MKENYKIDWNIISEYINLITELFKGNYNNKSILHNKILYLYIREEINDVTAKHQIELFKLMFNHLYEETDIRQQLRLHVLELENKYKPKKIGRRKRIKYKNKNITLTGYIFTMLPYLAKNWMDKNIKYLLSPMPINQYNYDNFSLINLLHSNTYKNTSVWLFMKYFLGYNSTQIGEKYKLHEASVRRKIMKTRNDILKILDKDITYI